MKNKKQLWMYGIFKLLDGSIDNIGDELGFPPSSSSLFSKFFTFPFQNLQGFISYLKRERDHILT
jgi:hypothetical protein